MDALILSRIQFAANISFHILFPTITIAMGWLLLFFKLRHNATGDPRWSALYQFWVKIGKLRKMDSAKLIEVVAIPVQPFAARPNRERVMSSDACSPTSMPRST